MSKTHPGLDIVSNFYTSDKSESIRKLFDKGYIIIKNNISFAKCEELITSLNGIRNKYPYHIESSNTYAGVFRSPFIFFNSYRDLMLNSIIHSHLKEIFPCKYQLHLNRCVENKPNKIAATVEWHRDIPYIHTPNSYPLSISALTFLSPSKATQIELLLDSHIKHFYSLGDADVLSLNPKPGDTILFDSNLIHRTLPTVSSVYYNLYMFSSPIIKPVVDYSSESVKKLISSIPYRLEEVFKLIGYEFLVPRDDLEYMNNKQNT